jgi:Domain of Unknown Function (DUF1080)
MAAEAEAPVGNHWHKVIAGVFASVVAPVLVAAGIKWSDTVIAPAQPAAAPAASTPATPAATATPPATTATPVAGATAPAAATAAPVGVVPGPPPGAPPLPPTPPAGLPTPTAVASAAGATVASAAADTGPPIAGTPAALPHFKKPLAPVQRLFNGRDLTGFYTYLGRPRDKSEKGKPYGKNHDPDKVFSVEKGILRVSGEMLGVLETDKEFSDYWLTVEYKWGEKTWPPDENDARRSAILLNIDGPDGVFHNAFPASFHVQLNEGVAGDFLIAAATGEEHYSLTAAVEQKQVGKQNVIYYTPGVPRSTFSQGVIKRYPPSPLFHNVKGWRPPVDLEKPLGDWNTIECASLNGKLLVQLNGKVVNFAIESTPSKGRIGIQSHGAELFIRQITLQPYTKHHEHGETAN